MDTPGSRPQQALKPNLDHLGAELCIINLQLRAWLAAAARRVRAAAHPHRWTSPPPPPPAPRRIAPRLLAREDLVVLVDVDPEGLHRPEDHAERKAGGTDVVGRQEGLRRDARAGRQRAGGRGVLRVLDLRAAEPRPSARAVQAPAPVGGAACLSTQRQREARWRTAWALRRTTVGAPATGWKHVVEVTYEPSS